MSKILGKITKEELSKLQETKEKTLKYQNEKENIKKIYDLKMENINLKIEIENLIKSYTFKEIKSKYPDNDFLNIVINEDGEIIDTSKEEEIKS